MDTRVGWELTLAALLLAFALSMTVSWVYSATYRGLSYVRSFAIMLAVAGIVSALVMLAIGDEIARGLGLVGAIAVIRFRTSLKDTRDLMFAFAALAIGIACGTLAFPVAILGTAVFCGAVVYLSLSQFGSRQPFNAILRLQVPANDESSGQVQRVLKQHAPGFLLIHLRDLGEQLQEHSYQVRLGDQREREQLLSALAAISGLRATNLLMQDSALEP
ncbi:MAG: DUF4956 domain-containing protein [Myxococcales bacterium]|nr:DUF4956 domain-containing protein [Myxococcales bacterium]